MKNKRISFGLLCVVLIILLSVRLYFVLSTDYAVVGRGKDFKHFLENTYENVNSGFSVKNIYLVTASFVTNILGNKELACISINIILQFISVLLLYIAFEKIINTYSAFAACVIISFWPSLAIKIFEASTFNIVHLLRSLFILLVSLVYSIVKKKTNNKDDDNNATSDNNKINEIGTEQNILLEDGIKNIKEEEDKMNINGNQEELPGMKEIKYKVQYIENPLPVPTRKEHKAMDFVLDIDKNNDFFDLNDMSGIDYFDIE